MKVWVPIVTIEDNIGAGLTTLLQKFEQSLSGKYKVTITIEHELIKEYQIFDGNDLINPLEHFYKNPTDNAFIFENYVLDIYQQRMETLETVQHPCKVIIMNHGLDACQIFATVNKENHIKFGCLYLTEKYLRCKSKFFPGKLYATNGVLSKHWSLRGDEMCSIS